MFSLEELFCSVDDFCSDFEPGWKQQLLTQGKRRLRSRRLSLSEIMTIEIAFHLSAYKTFKTFYLEIVNSYWREAFPNLVSYNRASKMLPEQSSGHTKRVCRMATKHFNSFNGISSLPFGSKYRNRIY